MTIIILLHIKMNITKLFLLLLSTSYTLGLLELMNGRKKNAKEIQIGIPIEYSKNNNLFKFNFKGNDSFIILTFIERPEVTYREEVYLIDPNNTRHEMKHISTAQYEAKLELNGIYLIEIIPNYLFWDLGGKFNTYAPGSSEEINLDKIIYVNYMDYKTLKRLESCTQFKISNLNEDKYIYFINKIVFLDDKYPFYPDDPAEIKRETIFEVININNPEKSKKGVKIYKFEKNNEYLLNIHTIKAYFDNYRYPKFWFFEIIKENIKKINYDSGIISSNGPMIAIINSNQTKNFSIFSKEMDDKQLTIFYVETNKTIENNLEILKEFNFEEYKYYYNYNVIKIGQGESLNTILLIIPLNSKKKVTLYIPDEIENECKDIYFVPAQKTKLIYCDQKEEKNKFDSLNYVLTYKSSYKN